MGVRSTSSSSSSSVSRRKPAAVGSVDVGRGGGGGGQFTPPPYFCCPISLEVMADPVTLCTGQTYDRPSIERWLAGGNLTCPVTRQPLASLALTPNTTLLRLIQHWCVAHGARRVPTPTPPASPRHVAALARDLASPPPTQARALARLRDLASLSDRNRALISDLGVVPLIISALFDHASDAASSHVSSHHCSDCSPVDSSSPGRVCSHVSGQHCLGLCHVDCHVTCHADLHLPLSALASLLPLPPPSIRLLAQPHRLLLLSRLLSHGCPDCRLHAASIIESMAANLHNINDDDVVDPQEDDRTRSLIASTDGLLPSLSRLLSHHPSNPEASRAAARAAFALCLCPSNWEKAAQAGIAESLLECLPFLERPEVERGLATLEMLCKTAEGRERVSSHARAVCVMKTVMLKVSDQASECAAGVLLSICSHSKQVQEEAVEEGVFTRLLLLLQSHCSSRAKKKARGLLKLLRDNWADHPCISAPGITNLAPF